MDLIEALGAIADGMRDAGEHEDAAYLDRAAAALEAAREALVADRERWEAQKAAAIREQAGGMTRGDPAAVARCDAAIQIIDAAIDQALEWGPTLCDGNSVSYEDAEKAIAALGDGWRMPTRREWECILDHERHDPMLDPAQHPGVKPGYHWTSTPCPWARESAVFVVSSHNGYVDINGHYGYALVRAVRAVPGQSSGL